MPLLRSGTDRAVLRVGNNTLGGRGADALPIAALAWQPPVASITVPAHGPVLIRRLTASVVVRLDEQPLGVAPAELRHGTHIDIAGCRLTFEADMPGAVADPAQSAAVTTAPSPSVGTSPPLPPNLSPARLVVLKTGATFSLPGRKSVIGRDTECDVVIPDVGVSRRHASITPVPGGYLLTDESSNGTLVNGSRVAGTRILDHGDVLRLHDEEIRFELEGHAGGDPTPQEASRAATAILDMSSLRSVMASEAARTASRRSPTASLEIVRGPFAGASFHIERPVCSIGRGEQSDVRLRDDSVSTAHATLLRKGDTWYVVDLRSVNGTFVDSYRVAGERELPTGATLRVGAVEMIFRSFIAGVEAPPKPKPSTGVVGWVKRLFRKPPPHGDSHAIHSNHP
ncbi:MAG: FHA domain-containing protein [Gemmatimonadaceae bacterium]|nr:FHA domain-containing protein [Gemmatimonadaceae bacterium]NUO94357.1 FHA domain-containing protein [Gemmatimonadaceae bacterium]NUP57437.1 FHA domain-containing protein [Gemmatimonadaceae bacterium]